MTSGTHSTHPLLLLLLFGSLPTSVRGTICAGLTYYLATTTSGTFTSPDYPSNYGVNVFCSWLIVANDSSHVIRLTVDTSSLENPDGNGNCTYDYGKAYDGSDLSATLLGEWCGSSTATLTSTGTSMLVVFNSDYSTVATGFSATYEAGISWATSSSSDYTVIIAVSVSTFVLITGIVVFCCIRSKKKRDQRKAGTDKERLPEAVEDGKVADDDRYSVASKSRFSHRIVPTPRGARRQPVEVAVEPQHSAVTRVIAANAAAVAAARQKELKEQEKQERKKEQERKKAEEKAAKEEQRVKAAEEKMIAAEEKKKAAEEKRIAATKAAEEKKKAADEKKKAAEEKKKAAEEAEKKKAEERRKANATSGKRKKVGFQEQAVEMGDGSSPTPDGQTTASRATGERASRGSPKAGDTSISPVVMAGTSGTNDSLQATKTANEATQKGGEAATLDNKNAGETTAQTRQHSGSAAARSQEEAGESSAKQMVAAAALAASGNNETRSATRDKQTAGKITIKHNEKAGIVATENNPIAGNASTTHFLISGAIVSNDKQNAGETATKDTISKADKTTNKDNLKAGEIATKDKQKAEKTTKTNQKIRETAGETTSKDSTKAGVTPTGSGETTSKDSTKAGITPTGSGETTSKDSTKAGATPTGSGETTSKDSTKAGVTPTGSGETTSKDSTKARVTPTGSGETTSKDNHEAADIITKDASNAGEATGKDNPRTGASAQNGSNGAEETKANNWEVNGNILQKENTDMEKTKINAEETTPADKAGETTRPKSKFVLLPTNVVLVESAETRKRKAVENQWEKLSATRHDQFTAPGGNVKPLAAVAMTSAHNKYQGDNAKVKDREGTKVKGGEDGRRTQTAASATESVEKDEGIHMDYDGGDSGKSSPSSRPTTTHTPDDSVVTPSLVTSIITDNADHQPVPIEAPCKGGDGVKATPSFSGPAQGSVADIEDRLSHALRWTRQWTYQSQKFSEPDIPSELAIKRWNTALGQQGVLTTSPRTAKEAFLEVVDQATELKKIAPMTLDRHGKPVKPAARGRNHSIM